MELKDRVKQARKHAGFTQLELAKAVGVTQPAISAIERGVNARTSLAYTIAKVCDVNKDWLITGHGKMIGVAELALNTDVYVKSRKAPVLSCDSGLIADGVKEPESSYVAAWEVVPVTDSPHVFWMRMQNDSMTARTGVSIPEGALAKVDPTFPARNGSIVVVRVVAGESATIKQLVIDGSTQFLKPLNPSYPVVQAGPDCVIVGVVTEVKIKIDP